MKYMHALTLLSAVLVTSIGSPAQTLSRTTSLEEQEPSQASAAVYRTPRSQFSGHFQAASLLAGRFGINGRPLSEEGGTRVKEGDRSLFVSSETGEIRYTVDTTGRRNPHLSMSVASHQSLAVSFLKRAGYSESEFFLENTAEHRVGIGGQPETVEDVVYHFRRIVDGLAAYGPGTTLRVTVGKEGVVRSSIEDWHALQVHEGAVIESPSKRKQEVESRLRATRDQYARQGYSMSIPGKMKLVYLSQSDGEGGFNLVPAYLSVLEATAEGHAGSAPVATFHTACAAHPVVDFAEAKALGIGRSDLIIPSPGR